MARSSPKPRKARPPGPKPGKASKKPPQKSPKKPPKGKPSPLKGKDVGAWVAQSFAEYSATAVRSFLGRHYSFATALNQFVEKAKTYYRDRHERVVTETRWGELLYDTGPWDRTGDMTLAEVRRRGLEVLARVLTTTIPHEASCGAQFDRPCGCRRGELLALLREEGE